MYRITNDRTRLIGRKSAIRTAMEVLNRYGLYTVLLIAIVLVTMWA